MYKLDIEIDCQPGFPRPGDIANQIGMKWKSRRFNGGSEDGEFENTTRLFGSWGFERLYTSEEEANKDRDTFAEKLKLLYPERIRYAGWSVEEVKRNGCYWRYVHAFFGRRRIASTSCSGKCGAD